jgi:hypothetical protein
MAADEPKTDSVQTPTAGRSVIHGEVLPPKLPPLCRCAECGELFYRLRQDQIFCPAPKRCRRTYHRRKEVRGARLYEFAMEWRRTRRKGGFTELTQMIDGFLAEDRAREERRKKGTKS